jgi:L-fucose mutarotase
MLKGIPPIISPELMAILMQMGHGDALVIADGNFPAASHAQRLVRADGHGVPALLDAVLRFLPLDTFVPRPVILMRPADDSADRPPIWQQFDAILHHHAGGPVGIELRDRNAFYEAARNAYAIVATGETAVYANILLVKGVVHLPPEGHGA